jgi:hypothetical protein
MHLHAPTGGCQASHDGQIKDRVSHIAPAAKLLKFFSGQEIRQISGTVNVKTAPYRGLPKSLQIIGKIDRNSRNAGGVAVYPQL